MKMRLDKLMTAAGLLSRSECAKAARAGRISVNGTVTKSASTQIDPDSDRITLDGTAVSYNQYVYVMLHRSEEAHV